MRKATTTVDSSINHDNDDTIRCLIVMYTVRPGGTPSTFILDVM